MSWKRRSSKPVVLSTIILASAALAATHGAILSSSSLFGVSVAVLFGVLALTILTVVPGRWPLAACLVTWLLVLAVAWSLNWFVLFGPSHAVLHGFLAALSFELPASVACFPVFVGMRQHPGKG